MRQPATRKASGKRAQPQSWPQPNPALKDLEPLVGEWETELFESSFLPSPSDRVKMQVSFSWVEDGAFLEMRQGDKPLSPPAAIWLIGRDESSGNYEVLYYDGRGVSRIYSMSYADGVWKMWRDNPGFSQRYEASLSPNHNRIDARWEKSSDGTNWALDFKMTYTRA